MTPKSNMTVGKTTNPFNFETGVVSRIPEDYVGETLHIQLLPTTKGDRVICLNNSSDDISDSIVKVIKVYNIWEPDNTDFYYVFEVELLYNLKETK